MNIGEKIKIERLKNGWTQEQVANQLKVSRSTISSWEVNRNYPDIEMLVTISDLFQLSLDDLLREESDMNQMKLTKVANQFQVTDEKGQLRYYMTTQPTLPTQKKFIIEDKDKQFVGTIKRKRYSLGAYNLPRLYLKVTHWDEISIIKDMKEFRSLYDIQGEGLAIEGHFLGENFTVVRKREVVAKVTVTKLDHNFSFNMFILDEKTEDLMISFMFLVALVYEEEKNSIQF